MNNSINRKDILLEIYNKKKLTSEVLESLINNNHNDLYISSSLIKLLIKENEMEILKIVFDNLKFYDNGFIKWLLFLYKNKAFTSTKNINQEISKDKYKIMIEYEKVDNFYNSICYWNYSKTKNMNKNLINYLVEHGIDINKEDLNGETVLFKACESGNKDLVEYLIKYGADINKESEYGETPLFRACDSGNKDLVEYLIELGAYLNKENLNDETPLFNACLNGNKDLVEYLIEYGADINKESKYGQTPLFDACLSEIKI